MGIAERTRPGRMGAMCGGSKNHVADIAEKDQMIADLIVKERDIDIKYKAAMEKLDGINKQLHMMIIPRTITEMSELEARMKQDPEMDKPWTELDETELNEALVTCLST